MPGDLCSPIACRVLIVLTLVAAGGTVWLAVHGHPVLTVLVGWFAFLTLLLGGLVHHGHNRNRQKGYTTR